MSNPTVLSAVSTPTPEIKPEIKLEPTPVPEELPTPELEEEIIITPTITPTTTPIPKIPTLTPTTPPQLNKTNINVPEHDTVYLYSKPSLEANIIYKLTTSQAADIVVETKRWAKVILSKINIEGWVSQDFIQKNTP